MTEDHQKLRGDDFSLSNRGDQTPHPQHQAGGSCEILQQHNGPAISGVPGVDLGPTFNRPLFGAVALSTGHGGEERTNKGGRELSRVVGQPNLVSNRRQQDMVKRELITNGGKKLVMYYKSSFDFLSCISSFLYSSYINLTRIKLL